MSPWFRLLVLRLGRGVLLAHLSGVVLLLLIALVERNSLMSLPSTWAALSAALSLVGSALATAAFRQDGGVLAMGTLGQGSGRILVVGALLGALAGLPAAGLLGAPPADGLRRVEGGWVVGDVVVPDVPEGVVTASPQTRPLHPFRVGDGAAGAALGVVLGLRAGVPGLILGTGTFLVGDLLLRGAGERGAAIGEGWAAVLALCLGVVFGRGWEHRASG